MTLVGLLSFYDETSATLATCIHGMATGGIGHVVAVDGAYALYPDAQAASPLEQAGALAAACRLAGIGLTLHVPREPWAGNEVQKRSFLFAAGWMAAQPGDWYWVIDADEVVASAPDDLGQQLAASDFDAATVRMVDQSTGDDFAARRLYRAARITVSGNHYTYIRESDGATLFHGGHSDREVAALDLTAAVTVDHRPGMRPKARQWAKSGYYDTRNEQGIERGQCGRCDQPAVTRMPVRWRFPAGKAPESDLAELCGRHAEWADRENRRRLAAHGFDPNDFSWRERYTPLSVAATAAA